RGEFHDSPQGNGPGEGHPQPDRGPVETVIATLGPKFGTGQQGIEPKLGIHPGNRLDIGHGPKKIVLSPAEPWEGKIIREADRHMLQMPPSPFPGKYE